MAHLHSVYDTDKHFSIDAMTRAIKNESNSKTKVMQYDHNSEWFTFEIPRHIEGHDMFECNAVKIEFINVDAKTKESKAGSYPVDDMQISPNAEDEDVIIFSWLISQNATQLAGSLNFLVRFLCVAADGETIDYAWHSDIFTGISVSSGMYNGEMILEQYSDVLEQWRIGYFGDIDNCLDEIIATQEIYILEAEVAAAQAELTETQEVLTEAEVQADGVIETQNTYIGGEE